jgi:fermentation-respiration switch protein FrsA (DUF1100 family)
VHRSPYPSLPDVAGRRFPRLPVRWLLRDRYPVASWIAGYDGPVLVIAGARDRLVPVADSRRVVDAAAGRAQLLVVPGVGHNHLDLLAGDVMLDRIASFLREQVGLEVRAGPTS